MSTNQLHLLRTVVACIKTEEIKATVLTQAALDSSTFLKAKFTSRGMVGIDKGARASLYDLAKTVFEDSPQIRRGAVFGKLYNELADFLIVNFHDRAATSLVASDLAHVKAAILAWFSSNIASEEIYVPCSLTPRPGKAFGIGPIRFTHIDEFVREQKALESPDEFERAFGRLLSSMQQGNAFWIATVVIDGCMSERAWELGELAIDVALAGVQLVVPHENELMARANGRTIPRQRFNVSRRAGGLAYGMAWQLAGFTVGEGLLEQLLSRKRAILDSIGRRIDAFIAQSAKLPTLEQAWVDGAYWFHQALAEPLDTIAIAQFETAVEVLLHAESSSGSKRRIIQALETFYSLSADQPINTQSTVTVKQFAERVSGDRARVLHGTWLTLTHSARESRPNIEAFVGTLLILYVKSLEHFAADSAAADNLDAFLIFTKRFREEQPLT